MTQPTPFSDGDASKNDGSAIDVFSVTPDDNTDLATYARRLWVGSAGHVEIVTPKGNTAVYKNCQDGSYIYAMVARVKATNTTATDILAEV